MNDRSDHSPVACMRAWQLLRVLHDRISRQIELDLHMCCAISETELRALMSIQEAGAAGVRLTSLCDQVGLSQPAVSRLVERLAERQLVIRRIDDQDRRSVLLELAPAGKALTRRAAEIHAATVHTAIGSVITRPNQRDLLEVLESMSPSEYGRSAEEPD